jgi:hypothetical protein
MIQSRGSPLDRPETRTRRSRKSPRSSGRPSRGRRGGRPRLRLLDDASRRHPRPGRRDLTRSGARPGRLGCTCESVVGEGARSRRRPAERSGPPDCRGVDLAPFAIDEDETWPEAAGTTASAVLLLGEPFSSPPRPGSAARLRPPGDPGDRRDGQRRVGPGAERLVLGDEVRRSGAVGVALRGAMAIRTIVSQGVARSADP